VTEAVRAVAEDSSEALAPFRPGGEFTVGVEDELLLVDRHGELGGNSTRLIARLGRDGVGASTASPEIFLSQVEFNTPVCGDAATLGRHLAQCRSALAAAGQLAMAAGVHPTAELGLFQRTRSHRYDDLADEFAGVLRTPTSAFQVHVGMPDTGSLIDAYRGIRNNLPVLRALGATSPYWHGRDSGLASARAAVIRSYPRVGVPPKLRSYDAYEAAVHEEMAAAEVPDYTYVCWEVRPHPRFGTLEVRVMDAQPSLRNAIGLVALVQGLARHAAENPPVVDLPHAVLAADDFRALRHGLETRIVDVDGRMRPMREVAAAAVAQARAGLAGMADDEPLTAIDNYVMVEPEYERQRRIHAEHGMRAVVTDLVERTVGDACREALVDRRTVS
jgi:glutamate---cysteine ligase / carboxylate-amine ligase